MARTKIAITLDDALLAKLDRLVASGRYSNRSRAIEEAVVEQLGRIDRIRLARESAKLDPCFEQSLAEEGIGSDAAAWPEY